MRNLNIDYKEIKMNIEQKRIRASESQIKIQSADGNWNYDPYMHGMLNGMLLTHSVFTDKKYEPYDAPKRWKYLRWYEKIINRITGKHKAVCEISSNSVYVKCKNPVHDIQIEADGYCHWCNSNISHQALHTVAER